MVTAQKPDLSQRLGWDIFMAGGESLHLRVFRRDEWPRIKRELWQHYGWKVADGVEPHWTAPGAAVLWHRTIQRVPDKEAGVWKEQPGEWQQTSSLPASSSILAHYLNKGFRLRPPLPNGVEYDAVKGVEFAVTPAAVSVDDRPNYECKRHLRQKHSFKTWGAYIAHCDDNYEAPQATPPKEITEKAKQFAYYCYQHDFGCDSEHMANEHITGQRRRAAPRGHVSAEQMRVKKEK